MFTGGEDVSPTLYGHEIHPTTYANIHRDVQELEIFNKIKTDQLVIGVCRGSQLLCALNGGKLIQNVTNHAIAGVHPITFRTGETYDITSTHHQMQYPYNLPAAEYRIIAYSSLKRSDKYEGDPAWEEAFNDMPQEPEIVLYCRQNMPTCLAIQGHPEVMPITSPVINKINAIINNHIYINIKF